MDDSDVNSGLKTIMLKLYGSYSFYLLTPSWRSGAGD